MTGFTRGDVARICKIEPRRLRYWERTALLEPRGGFEFRDLVGVKTIVELLERGVPLRRIRRSVEEARRCLPELDRPLGSLRVWMEGSERVVVRHGGVLLEPDGQTVIDFSSPVREGEVSRLAPCGGEASQRCSEPSALDWFERGCELDTEPATYELAIDAYRSALEADPEFADAHCNLGSVYFNQGRSDEARACFERAVALEPRHVEAHLNLASLLEAEGRNETALQGYKTALAADPLRADTRVSLALLYEKLGLRRKALSHWRRYLQLEPAGTWSDLARRRLSD